MSFCYNYSKHDRWSNSWKSITSHTWKLQCENENSALNSQALFLATGPTTPSAFHYHTIQYETGIGLSYLYKKASILSFFFYYQNDAAYYILNLFFKIINLNIINFNFSITLLLTSKSQKKIIKDLYDG